MITVKNTAINIIKNGGLFAVLLFITGYTVFRNNDIIDIAEALQSVRVSWIGAGVLAMCVFIFCEGENIARSLRLFGEEVSRVQAVKYALTGFFFSAVTPSASGGQPMQLYVMHKDGIKTTHGTLALLFELLSFEIVTVGLSIIGYLSQNREINDSLGSFKLFLIAGITANCIVMAVLLAAIFSKKTIGVLCNLVVKLIKLFSLEKAEKVHLLLMEQIEDYQQSAKYFRENKIIFAKNLMTSLIQLLAMYSIPYLVYRGFGLSSYSAAEAISLQAVLYVAVSALPLPGAVGISESGFLKLFRMLFPTEFLGSAMILSRGISFYLFVLISGMAVAGFSLKYRMQKGVKGVRYGIYNPDCRG